MLNPPGLSGEPQLHECGVPFNTTLTPHSITLLKFELARMNVESFTSEVQ